jgi:hypothetical protein
VIEWARLVRSRLDEDERGSIGIADGIRRRPSKPGAFGCWTSFGREGGTTETNMLDQKWKKHRAMLFPNPPQRPGLWSASVKPLLSVPARSCGSRRSFTRPSSKGRSRRSTRLTRRTKFAFKVGQTMKLKIADIKIDRGTQLRVKGTDPDAVERYTDRRKQGFPFVPPTVFHDGYEYILADGFARIFSAIAVGMKTIDVEVKMGGEREAILHAVHCNNNNGLPPSRADQRNAVMRLLNDEEWHAWSNYQIARQCGVSEFTVRGLRPHSIYDNIVDEESRKCIRNGKEYTVSTGTIGRKPAISEKPELDEESIGQEWDDAVSEPFEEPDSDDHEIRESSESEARSTQEPKPITATLRGVVDEELEPEVVRLSVPTASELAWQLSRLVEHVESVCGRSEITEESRAMLARVNEQPAEPKRNLIQ